jgi:hypothetical protein
MKNNQLEKLLTELTPTDGADIIGGAVTIANGLPTPFNFGIRCVPPYWNAFQPRSIPPFDETTIYCPSNAQIRYDRRVGPVYEPITRTLTPGRWTANVSNGTIILSQFANLQAPDESSPTLTTP